MKTERNRAARRAEVAIARRRAAIPILIAVNGDHITLGQALKSAGIIGSGGEAKLYLASNDVIVNGEQDQRRGRKLRPGDVARTAGREIRFTAAETGSPESEPPE